MHLRRANIILNLFAFFDTVYTYLRMSNGDYFTCLTRRLENEIVSVEWTTETNCSCYFILKTRIISRNNTEQYPNVRSRNYEHILYLER